MGPYDQYRMQQYQQSAVVPSEVYGGPAPPPFYPQHNTPRQVMVTQPASGDPMFHYNLPPAADVNATAATQPIQTLPQPAPPLLDPYGRPIDPLYMPGGRRIA